MKNKKIGLLIKIMIPILVIGTCFGVERLISKRSEDFSNKVVVVNDDNSNLSSNDDSLEVLSKESCGNIEGFYNNFGFINNDEVLVSIGISREDFYKKYPNEFDKANEEEAALQMEAYNEIYGKLHKLNLSTLEKESLDVDFRDVHSNFISQANEISFEKDNEYLIYNFNNNSTVKYGDISENDGKHMGVWSQDGKYLITYNDNNGGLDLFNVEDNSTKNIKINSDTIHIARIPSFYSENGDEIYFIGEENKSKNSSMKREGIFKVNTNTEEIKQVFVMNYHNHKSDTRTISHINDNSNYSVLDEGKRIMFSGTIDGVGGIYIYDTTNEKFYNVSPNTTKSEDGDYVKSFSISPDKTKIIYKDLASDKDGVSVWNLYAASIKGNSLINKTCIYKLSGCEGDIVTWSPGSKKILFFTGNEKIEKNYFRFMDKNEINIITFK